MGQGRLTSRLVTVPAGGSIRVWDAACGLSIRDLSVFLSSRGTVTAAGNLTWTVYYGGNWQGTTPFAADSTHAGGVSQGTGVIAGGTEIASCVYTDSELFPANQPVVLPAPIPTLVGVPWVVDLASAKAIDTVMQVFFISHTVSDTM